MHHLILPSQCAWHGSRCGVSASRHASSASLQGLRGAVPLRTRGNGLCVHAANGSGGGGFGSGSTTERKPEEASTSSATPSASSSMDAAEALEARIRNRRARKTTKDGPRVKVNAPAVEATKGDAPLSPQAQAETNLVAGMLFLFYVIIIEGLVIAGSGFLPEDWDEFIENSLYPNYTPTVLLFLGLSTMYGLWKIGKLSLPFLGSPPPKEEQQ